MPRPPRSTLTDTSLPYSTLFRSLVGCALLERLRHHPVHGVDLFGALLKRGELDAAPDGLHPLDEGVPVLVVVDQRRDLTILGLVRLDRKSTRLNSSH